LAAGQTDGFQNGDPGGWHNSGGNPAAVLADSGPLGAGDYCLRSTSTGLSGSGGKQVMYNQSNPWTGNYSALAITQIRADIRNTGGASLPVRLAMDGAGGKFCTAATTIPNDGAWHSVTFSVAIADLTAVGGSNALATLQSLTMLRFLSSVLTSFSGDQIAASLDYDNITALAPVAPSPTATCTETGTATPTGTPSGTPTPTPSETATATQTTTPTAVDTMTGTPTPTGTQTETASATPLATFSATPSPVFSATSSPTETAVVTPQPTAAFSRSALGKAVLAPVPAKAGEPVCLFTESTPISSRWTVYNLAGDRVAALSFNGSMGHCWDTSNVKPGIYLVKVGFEDAGGAKTLLQKIALVK
jgi:hypothetical protein